MNPPILKSVCEEEMQNANLDTNGVIIEYMTDAHGNKIKRLVNEVLFDVTFACGYLDDILVFRSDMETHLEHLRLIFERLRSAVLKLKEVKCNFLK